MRGAEPELLLSALLCPEATAGDASCARSLGTARCDRQDTLSLSPGAGVLQIHPGGNARCPAGPREGALGTRTDGISSAGFYFPARTQLPRVIVCPEAAGMGCPGTRLSRGGRTG